MENSMENMHTDVRLERAGSVFGGSLFWWR